MEQELRKVIKVLVNSPEQEAVVLDNICSQLVGNQDFVDCRIVVNDSSTRNDGTENEVHVYIFNDCTSEPNLILSL